MAGNACAAVKHFDSGCRIPGVDFLSGIAVGNRVVVFEDFGVIVDANLHHFPFGKLIPRCRQRPQGRTVQFDEGRLAAARQLLEGTGIEYRHEFGNAPVELTEAEETLVPQAGEYPALDQEYPGLYFCLIFRTIRPGRKDCR